MSQLRMISKPPPCACPLQAAIIGFLPVRRERPANPLGGYAVSCAPFSPSLDRIDRRSVPGLRMSIEPMARERSAEVGIPFISMPAENAFLPAPVTIPTRLSICIRETNGGSAVRGSSGHCMPCSLTAAARRQTIPKHDPSPKLHLQVRSSFVSQD